MSIQQTNAMRLGVTVTAYPCAPLAKLRLTA